MTDRSSEGRSRTWTPLVEVIRREMLARFSDKLSMEEIASCAYAVAALEDRQEAASTDDERFHRAQSFLAATELIQAKCKAHGPNFPTTIPQIASFIVDFCKFKLSGVPSEATPSKHTTWTDVKAQMDATPTKENAPLPVPTYFVTHPYGSYSIADPAAGSG